MVPPSCRQDGSANHAITAESSFHNRPARGAPRAHSAPARRPSAHGPLAPHLVLSPLAVKGKALQRRAEDAVAASDGHRLHRPPRRSSPGGLVGPRPKRQTGDMPAPPAGGTAVAQDPRRRSALPRVRTGDSHEGPPAARQPRRSHNEYHLLYGLPAPNLPTRPPVRISAGRVSAAPPSGSRPLSGAPPKAGPARFVPTALPYHQRLRGLLDGAQPPSRRPSSAQPLHQQWRSQPQQQQPAHGLQAPEPRHGSGSALGDLLPPVQGRPLELYQPKPSGQQERLSAGRQAARRSSNGEQAAYAARVAAAAAPAHQELPEEEGAAHGEEQWDWLGKGPPTPESPYGSEILRAMLHVVSPRFAVRRPEGYIPMTPSSIASSRYVRSDVWGWSCPGSPAPPAAAGEAGDAAAAAATAAFCTGAANSPVRGTHHLSPFHGAHHSPFHNSHHTPTRAPGTSSPEPLHRKLLMRAAAMAAAVSGVLSPSPGPVSGSGDGQCLTRSCSVGSAAQGKYSVGVATPGGSQFNPAQLMRAQHQQQHLMPHWVAAGRTTLQRPGYSSCDLAGGQPDVQHQQEQHGQHQLGHSVDMQQLPGAPPPGPAQPGKSRFYRQASLPCHHEDGEEVGGGQQMQHKAAEQLVASVVPTLSLLQRSARVSEGDEDEQSSPAPLRAVSASRLLQRCASDGGFELAYDPSDRASEPGPVSSLFHNAAGAGSRMPLPREVGGTAVRAGGAPATSSPGPRFVRGWAISAVSPFHGPHPDDNHAQEPPPRSPSAADSTARQHDLLWEPPPLQPSRLRAPRPTHSGGSTPSCPATPRDGPLRGSLLRSYMGTMAASLLPQLAAPAAVASSIAVTSSAAVGTPCERRGSSALPILTRNTSPSRSPGPGSQKRRVVYRPRGVVADSTIDAVSRLFHRVASAVQPTTPGGLTTPAVSHPVSTSAAISGSRRSTPSRVARPSSGATLPRLARAVAGSHSRLGGGSILDAKARSRLLSSPVALAGAAAKALCTGAGAGAAASPARRMADADPTATLLSLMLGPGAASEGCGNLGVHSPGASQRSHSGRASGASAFSFHLGAAGEDVATAAAVGRGTPAPRKSPAGPVRQARRQRGVPSESGSSAPASPRVKLFPVPAEPADAPHAGNPRDTGCPASPQYAQSASGRKRYDSAALSCSGKLGGGEAAAACQGQVAARRRSLSSASTARHHILAAGAAAAAAAGAASDVSVSPFATPRGDPTTTDAAAGSSSDCGAAASSANGPNVLTSSVDSWGTALTVALQASTSEAPTRCSSAKGHAALRAAQLLLSPHGSVDSTGGASGSREGPGLSRFCADPSPRASSAASQQPRCASTAVHPGLHGSSPAAVASPRRFGSPALAAPAQVYAVGRSPSEPSGGMGGASDATAEGVRRNLMASFKGAGSRPATSPLVVPAAGLHPPIQRCPLPRPVFHSGPPAAGMGPAPPQLQQVHQHSRRRQWEQPSSSHSQGGGVSLPPPHPQSQRGDTRYRVDQDQSQSSGDMPSQPQSRSGSQDRAAMDGVHNSAAFMPQPPTVSRDGAAPRRVSTSGSIQGSKDADVHVGLHGRAAVALPAAAAPTAVLTSGGGLSEDDDDVTASHSDADTSASTKRSAPCRPRRSQAREQQPQPQGCQLLLQPVQQQVQQQRSILDSPDMGPRKVRPIRDGAYLTDGGGSSSRPVSAASYYSSGSSNDRDSIRHWSYRRARERALMLKGVMAAAGSVAMSDFGSAVELPPGLDYRGE